MDKGPGEGGKLWSGETLYELLTTRPDSLRPLHFPPITRLRPGCRQTPAAEAADDVWIFLDELATVGRDKSAVDEHIAKTAMAFIQLGIHRDLPIRSPEPEDRKAVQGEAVHTPLASARRTRVFDTG